MKQTQKVLRLMLMVFASGASLTVAEAGMKSPVQLVVNLVDGSRLVGTTSLASLPLRSEALGKVEIPLNQIRIVTFRRNHESVTVALGNGDKVQGAMGDVKLRMQTVFGTIMVPLEKITSLSVHGGTQTTVEFDPTMPYGLQFDGRQNCVEAPSDLSLDPTEAMTLECWFQAKARRTGGDFAMLGKRRWQQGIDHGYQLYGDYSGRLHAYWEGRDLAGTHITDDRWHHAALTWDGARRRLFQDGIKVAEDAPGTWTPSEGNFRVGGIDSSNPRAFFDGKISEVRLSKTDRYKGQNFTPARCFAIDNDTVVYWKLNEGFGSIVYDQSDNGHDGALVGTPPPQWINPVP